MTLAWTAVLIGGLAVGVSIVGLLVLKRNQEPFALIIGVAGVVFGTWGMIEVLDAYQQAQMVIAAVAVSLAALGGGYALASTLLPYLKPRRWSPSLTAEVTGRTSRPVILVVACVEPERYAPSCVTDELDRLSTAGLPEATVGITPFLYAAQKARFRAMGGTSPARRQLRMLAERLELELGNSVDSVVPISCSGTNTLGRAIEQAAVRGAVNFIVTSVEIGESYIVDRAKASVDALRPSTLGIEIAYTAPLWGSELLAEHVAESIWKASADPYETGVVLVLHGQPDAWEQTHAAFDVEENSFANRIRMLVAERGIPQDNVRLCFAEWRPPDVTESVRHLAALGCTRILVSPAVFPFDDSITMLDIQVGIKQARVDAHVSTVILPTWGQSDAIVAALQRGIRASATEIGLAGSLEGDPAEKGAQSAP